jgi:hypothetical protein
MAYEKVDMTPDEEFQDIVEAGLKSAGPYDCAGGGETCIAVVQIGDFETFSYVMSDIKAQAFTGKVYVCNQATSELHSSAPQTNNRVVLVDTLTVGAGESKAGYIAGSWKYLIFTETSAGAETENIMLDLHGEG